MSPPPLPPLHRADFTLSDEQHAVLDAFDAFFARECPPQRVRDTEPHGFDADLWKHLVEMRTVAMGVDTRAGGDGAGLVELVLVAEQWGKHLAPVPVGETIAAARLLGRLSQLGPAAAEPLHHALDGDHMVTLALTPVAPGRRQLVPAAAIADSVVARLGDDIVIAPIGDVERVPNQGHTPLAWLDPTANGTTVLASGPAAIESFTEMVREWRLLMAAALTGMADATLALAVEHARDRVAFGVPIGSFQAVAHPLVDVAMNVETSRRLCRKAAWWADTDPGEQRELIPMAYHFAEHTAVHATTVGVHALGGVGFTVESDVQLYFRRAKGWTLVGGDPEQALDEVADAMFGPAGSAGQGVPA